MKIASILLALLVAAGSACAAPFELRIVQRDATDTSTWTRLVAPPNALSQSSILLYDSGTGLPLLANFTGLGWNGTTLSAPAAAAPAQGAASRALNSAFQVSASRGAFVFYSVQMQVTASITSGQDGQCVLEIAGDSGFTTAVQTLAISPGSQVYTLAIALQGVQKSPCSLSGFVPAGSWARLRTVSTTGTPVFTYLAGQEVLF